MIKKIDANQLKAGMYIHNLSCDWMSHPFLVSQCEVKSEAEIHKIIDAGIYPTGTLVMLELGKLGLVTEQHETNLLQPTVKVFFSTCSNSYITPVEIDLSHLMGKGGADKIVSHEYLANWILCVSLRQLNIAAQHSIYLCR